jgi:hypothetical protein
MLIGSVDVMVFLRIPNWSALRSQPRFRPPLRSGGLCQPAYSEIIPIVPSHVSTN